MQYDNGQEQLSPQLARIFLQGLDLHAAPYALDADNLYVTRDAGLATILDHVQQIAGDELVQILAGTTLAADSEVISDVVLFWNEDVSGMFVQVVDGTQALSTDGASAPTDAEVAAALPNSDFRWCRAGRVQFTTDSSSNVTLHSIDRTVRPMEVRSSAKDAPAAGYQEKAVVGADADQYLPWGSMDFTVDAADIANGDLMTDRDLPLMYGRIRKWSAVVEKAITTGAKTTTPSLDINADPVTGSDGVALAGTHALGAQVDLGAPTAANTFKPGDTLTIKAAATTPFTEGRVRFSVELDKLHD